MIRQYIDLLEAHQYSLLTESARIDYLRKTHAEALGAKFESENVPQNVLDAIEAGDGDTPGEKVLDYIVEHDPTRNKQYTQWLVLRYLKGEFLLEDLWQSIEYLTVFERAKARLAKRDINTYASLAELYMAIRPFIEGEQAVSNRQEKEAIKQTMKSDDSIDVLYDDGNFTVLTPKTEEAAIFWGRGTRWCTAASSSHNYFDHYNRQGPLYIIIDRKAGIKRQFHFPSGQFMNELDQRINLREFVTAYPQIMEIIGEPHFAFMVKDLGLSFFSAETLSRMPRSHIADAIHSYKDFMLAPEEMRADAEFIGEVMHNMFSVKSKGDDKEAEKIIKLYVGVFTDEQWDEVVSHCPTILNHLPPRFSTPERKLLAAKVLTHWLNIENHLAKPWSNEIQEIYWSNRVANDNNLRIHQLPKEFRTPLQVITLLIRHNSDIDKHQDILTPEMAVAIVRRKFAALWHINEKRLLTQDLMDLCEISVNDEIVKNTDNGRSEYSVHVGGHPLYNVYKELTKFDPKLWPVRFAPKMMPYGGLKFTDLPERLRTPEMVRSMIEREPNNITTIPSQYLSVENIHAALATSSPEKILQNLDPSVLTEEVVLDFLEIRVSKYYSLVSDKFWSAMPDRLRTPKIASKIVSMGSMPISKMPSALMTDEAIARRVKHHHEEIADIPSVRMGPLLAETIVRSNYQLMQHFPDSILCEPVLFAFLEGVDRGQDLYGDNVTRAHKQFKRFPKTMWSERVVELAVKRGFLDAKVEAVPQEFVTKSVAERILARDANEIGLIPEEFLDEDSLFKIAAANPRIVTKLTPEKVTERVAYAAVKRWAHNTTIEYREALLDMPRTNWSRRVYEAAVGQFITLKQVPARWRDDQMARIAVGLDPMNLRYLDDPASFMRTNKDVAKLKDEKWLKKFEDAGFFKAGKDFIDVEDLDKEALDSGGFCVVRKVGPTNYRVFLFNTRGKLVGRMLTKKDAWTIPDFEELKEIKGARAMIMEVLQRHFATNSFELGDIEHFYIFKNGSGRYWTPAFEENLPRKTVGGLDWSETQRGEDNLYTGWSGNKLVVRIFEGASAGGWGNKGKVRLQNAEIHDIRLGLKHATDIMEGLNRFKIVPGWDRTLYKVGIISTTKGEWINIHTIKVGEVGELSVWRNVLSGGRIGLFGENGMISQAQIKIDGSIYNVNDNYDYREYGNKIATAWQAVEDSIKGKAK